ncbi:MAG TPA: AEC family transporter [Negativicutes bacterium]
MDIKMKLLLFVFDLLAPLIVGYFCRFQHVVKESFFDKMILNNILVIYPALSFFSFWVLPLHYELIWLPVMGLVMGLIPGLVAYFVAEYKYTSDLDKGSYVMSAILSNLGTIGGLCVFLLYGETGYAYQQLVVLFQYILMFVFCYPLAQYYYQRSQEGIEIKRVSLRSILFNRNQLAVVGILCGVVLQQSGVPRPQFFGSVVEALIHFGAWTALIPVGYLIDFVKLKDHYREIKDLTLIKFVFTPLLTYGVASLVISNEKMLHTLLILACTPTAINAVMISRIYSLNIHIAVAAFILTTIVFLLVVYPALFIGLSI